MAITPPVAGQQITVEAFGIPITNEVNRMTPITTVTAWTQATLQNGWAHQAGQVVQYRKVGDMVQIRGRMDGGTSGFVAYFLLPVGFRPPYLMQSAIAVVKGGAWNSDAIQILTNGEVTGASAGIVTYSFALSFSVST